MKLTRWPTSLPLLVLPAGSLVAHLLWTADACLLMAILGWVSAAAAGAVAVYLWYMCVCFYLVIRSKSEDSRRVRRAIAALPTRKYISPADDDDDEGGSCAICLSEFDDGEEVRLLPCMHEFCKECIDVWIQRQGLAASCPLCKRMLVPTSRAGDHQRQAEPGAAGASADDGGGGDGGDGDAESGVGASSGEREQAAIAAVATARRGGGGVNASALAAESAGGRGAAAAGSLEPLMAATSSSRADAARDAARDAAESEEDGSAAAVEEGRAAEAAALQPAVDAESRAQDDDDEQGREARDVQADRHAQADENAPPTLEPEEGVIADDSDDGDDR